VGSDDEQICGVFFVSQQCLGQQPHGGISMRRQLGWFVGGALLFALLVGTAGPSFAAQEWNVTGSGTIALFEGNVPSGETATFRLSAVVVVSNLDGINPATGSFTYRDATIGTIRGTIRQGVILPKDKDSLFSGVDAAFLFGTYPTAQGPAAFELLVAEPTGSLNFPGLLAIWLDGHLFPDDDPDSGGVLSLGSIRIFSQDQQGQNGQGGNHQ
jgi:hypothetical protein